MKLNRKIFFKIHSWIGIQLSILFFIVCFSGTLATLSREMDWLFQPQIRAVYQNGHADKNTIVKNIKAAYPTGNITFWQSSQAPYLCDIVYVNIDGQRWYVFANPYTGQVQGATTLTFQRFFRDFHYFLFMPFLQIGYFIVLAFGFMLFISIVTALLFYKKWWKKLFELKTRKGSLVFFRSLHRLVGVWSVPFAILFSITGIWYFIERTNMGNVNKIANPPNPRISPMTLDSVQFSRLSYQLDYNKIVQAAIKEIPNLTVKDILPPRDRTSPIYLTGHSKVPLVRARANRVWVHPRTYEVIGSQKADRIRTIIWLNDIADPLHFGTWGGLPTKIIWFFAGLGISSLVFTGIWISTKRKIKNFKKTYPKKWGTWNLINLMVVAAFLVSMFRLLINRYKVSIPVLALASLFFAIMVLLAWYIFILKLKRK